MSDTGFDYLIILTAGQKSGQITTIPKPECFGHFGHNSPTFHHGFRDFLAGKGRGQICPEKSTSGCPVGSERIKGDRISGLFHPKE